MCQNFFLLLNNIPLHEYILHVLFICLSIDGHLCHFCYLAVVTNATVSIHVQTSVYIRVFISLESLPRSGTLGPVLTLCV